MSLEVLVGIIVLAAVVFFVLRRRNESGPSLATPATGRVSTVEELIAAGRKIDAIKLYRAQNDAGLREAKDAVEAMARGIPR